MVGAGGESVPPKAGADAAVPLVERDQAGGRLPAVELADGRAYIAVGPRMAIWSVADPDAPFLLGETAPLEQNVVDIAVAGTRAYVTGAYADYEAGPGLYNGFVHIFDVADAARPALVTSFRLGTAEAPIGPGTVLIAGNRLYVGHAEAGISVFDLTDPDAPQLIKVVGGGGDRMQIVGTRLYYMGQNFIGDSYVGALDLANDFAELGAFVVPGASAASVSPNHILVTTGAQGLDVKDVHDLGHPRDLFHDGDPALFAGDIVAGATAAWVPGQDGLYAIDLGPQPRKVGPLLMPTLIANAADEADGLLAVVTDRGRLVLSDVSNPMAPVAKGVADASLCVNCVGVFADRDRLVVAASSGGLRTARRIDLAGAGRASGGRFRDDFEDVVVAKDIAYVADWISGLRIYDISKASAPRALGSFPAVAAGAVAYAKRKVYLGEAAAGGNLYVIDVADPASPKLAGSVLAGKVWDVEVGGGLAYVTSEQFTEEGGLRIIDVSTPAAARVVGHFSEGCEYALDVAVTGTIAVLACYWDGFQFVDVSNPAAPKKVGSWPVPRPNSAAAVAVDGNRAYLGHDGGLIAVDITNPAAPTRIAERKTTYSVRSIALATPNRVIAGCGLGGVVQWSPRRERR